MTRDHLASASLKQDTVNFDLKNLGHCEHSEIHLSSLVVNPDEDPDFFALFIEKRHADHLQRKMHDKESRLEIMYRVIKDQMRKIKKDLLISRRKD